MRNETTDVDVLVVGAGPVGLVLAGECLRHGARVRLVEKLPVPSEKSKALAIWSSAQEALGIMGCVAEFQRRGTGIREVCITTEGKPIARIDVDEGVDSPYPTPILLPQSETEAILTEHLRGLGGEIERAREFLSFEQTSEGIRSVVRGPEGEETIRSRWLVGCDGAHSTIRHGIGGEFDGYAMPETFALCDAVLTPAPLPEEPIIDWSEHGAFAIFAVRPGVFRVIATRREDDPWEGDPTVEEMHEHLARHGRGDWRVSDPTWLATFRVSERKVKSFRSGNVLLAGDAAHIHSPAGGQGMNTGMQDAFNLGWKLGLLARGRGDESALLESYHEERSPVADKVLREAAFRTRVSLFHNPVAVALRNLVVRGAGATRGFQAKFARNLSGLDIAYGESSILGRDDAWNGEGPTRGFRPGERIRDVTLPAPVIGGVPLSLYREIVGGPHCLVVFSGIGAEGTDLLEFFVGEMGEIAGDAIKAVMVWRGKRPPIGSLWIRDPDGVAHALFGVRGSGIYLVRPDGYVAARCQVAERSVIAHYVQRVLGRRRA